MIYLPEHAPKAGDLCHTIGLPYAAFVIPHARGALVRDDIASAYGSIAAPFL